MSSPFGPRKNPNGSYGFHTGIDLAAVRGTPVKAATSGVVLQAGCYKGYGNMVLLKHDYNVKTRYAHLSKIDVSVGQSVDRGDIIGRVGNTGHVRRRRGRDGSHLHFEVYVAGKRVNPLALID
jgi:murein DD-endopeptidase MepM/ murein hydrolase activator NlpD